MNKTDITPVALTETVKAFQSAAIITLKEMTQIEAFPESTSPAMVSIPSDEVIMATIRLLRPIPGTMTLVLTANAASQLAARYLPEGTQLSEELINDVVGEFANVIAGQAKTILKGTPYHFSLSTPVVTRAASSAQLPDNAAASRVTLQTSELGSVFFLINLPPCPDA